jgi:hypothetical protein
MDGSIVHGGLKVVASDKVFCHSGEADDGVAMKRSAMTA